MIALNQQPALSAIGKSVITTFLYYDIFSYPLSLEEIYDRCNVTFITLPKLELELSRLVESKILYYHKGFYLLQDNVELVERRLKGNEQAKKYLKRARFLTKIIAGFPYVRAVMLSGSISKDYMDENSDIDYFIVTEQERLWITRSCLYIFMKILKLLGFNTKKYFCLNYFVDNKNLEIEEKNLFTATEIVTLIPIFNSYTYKAFLKANSWTSFHYPNFPQRNAAFELENFNPIPKQLMEKILNNNSGKRLNEYLMEVTTKRWDSRRSVYRFNDEDYKIAIKARKHLAKQHAHFHQKRILEKFSENVNHFELKYNITLQ